MRSLIPKSLKTLADACDRPVYVVGGAVRDFLCGFFPKKHVDWDICSPASEDVVLEAAKQACLTVRSVFKHTGAVKLLDGEGNEFEFTRFRSDKYVRGEHVPSEIIFTEDIEIDARRRDFTCNAVYYDVKAEKFVDPLGGMEDIKRKILRTVAPADKVFGEDGLRLMRLCRFAAQLGFVPDGDCLNGAKNNCSLIGDIVPERIFHELELILRAEKAHGVADGVYRGLTLLRDSGVLQKILPELALGDGLYQRKDFHDHDVLEHSIRAAAYAPSEVRLAALLHDVGKPFCFYRDGNYHAHDVEGARIANEILARLKAPKKLASEVCSLVLYHMRDLNCAMRESKVRTFIAEHFSLLEKLFLVKQADYSACKDDLSSAPTVVRWQGILEQMKREGAPRTISELKIKGDDLVRLCVPPHRVGDILRELLYLAALDGRENTPERLAKHALRILENG